MADSDSGLAVRDAERREQTRAELEQLHHKDLMQVHVRVRFHPYFNDEVWLQRDLARALLEAGFGEVKAKPVKDCTFKPQINPVSEIIATSRVEAGLALFAIKLYGQPAWFGLFQQASTSSGRAEASQIQALRAVTSPASPSPASSHC